MPVFKFKFYINYFKEPSHLLITVYFVERKKVIYIIKGPMHFSMFQLNSTIYISAVILAFLIFHFKILKNILKKY